VYDLEQFYCAPNITAYARKKYYFAEYQGAMKLISEDITPLNPNPHIEKTALEFVEKWRKAWESADLENYATFYANQTNRWLENKRKLFTAGGVITVNISNISWRTGPQNTLIVEFHQDYSSDVTKDSGVKTLTIKGCPSSYKIISEVWSAK
jgi:murein L,D-transpeptidase YafK